MKKTLAVAALMSVALAGAAEARDQIRIVGSSTVFPFATAVAEEFGKTTSFKTPVIESTGSGGGLKLVLRRCWRTAPGHHQRFASHQEVRSMKNVLQTAFPKLPKSKLVTTVIVLSNSNEAPQLDLTKGTRSSLLWQKLFRPRMVSRS